MDERLKDFNPIRTRSDEEALKQGYVWDAAMAERVIEFLETFCRLFVGRWAGQQIKLMPYQFDFIARLYGWIDPETGFRRFREAYLEAAKKQGKTPVIGGVCLFHLIGDKENAPEVIINATSRDQASICFRNIQQMIALEPEFDGVFHQIDSQKKILCPQNNGLLLAASADAPSKQGFQPSLTIFDELGQQPNRDLWDAFEFAQRSREQPLKLSITNAGEPDPAHPCYQQHKRALAVEDGSLIDVRFLGVVHGPRGENPDVNDREVWRAANPALGHIISERDIEEELEKAKLGGPASLQVFKRYILSIWEKQERKWLDMGLWGDQPVTRSDEAIADSGDVWCGGFDMSNGGDLCAYVRAAGHPRDGVDCRAHFWIPRDTAVRRAREEHLPYLEWADQGLVTLIDGPVVDPLEVRDWIIADAAKLEGRLKRVYSDEWNSAEIKAGLRKAGIDHQYMVHGYKSFHPPMRVVESMLARHVLRHGDHPILTVNAGNAQVDDNNPNRNKRLVKPKDTARIDGAVCLVQAVVGLMDLVGYDGESPTVEDQKPIEDGRIIWRPLGNHRRGR